MNTVEKERSAVEPISQDAEEKSSKKQQKGHWINKSSRNTKGSVTIKARNDTRRRSKDS